MNQGYNEQAVIVGRTQSLFGMLTLPDGTLRAHQPTIVIVNTGIVHRVGHHRMYVTMARQLARAGHAVLRFDLSGIGDSHRRADGMSPNHAALEDMRETLDWLAAKTGSNKFVIVGLCSGSEIALRYGHLDRRVVGLVLLDPEVPPTARFYLNYIRERIYRIRSWLTFVKGRGRIWQELASLISTASSRDQDPTERHSASDLEQHYRASLAHGLQLFVALTGGDLAWRQNYREQLLDAFPSVPFEDNLRLEHFPNSDHTLTPPEDRSRLNGMIEEWLRTTPFGQNSNSAISHHPRTAQRAMPLARQQGLRSRP